VLPFSAIRRSCLAMKLLLFGEIAIFATNHKTRIRSS
jgi:hypothetical protein